MTEQCNIIVISLPVYTLAGIQLSIVNEMRDLGVVIDAKLNFNSHFLILFIKHTFVPA